MHSSEETRKHRLQGNENDGDESDSDTAVLHKRVHVSGDASPERSENASTLGFQQQLLPRLPQTDISGSEESTLVINNNPPDSSAFTVHNFTELLNRVQNNQQQPQARQQQQRSNSTPQQQRIPLPPPSTHAFTNARISGQSSSIPRPTLPTTPAPMPHVNNLAQFFPAIASAQQQQPQQRQPDHRQQQQQQQDNLTNAIVNNGNNNSMQRPEEEDWTFVPVPTREKDNNFVVVGSNNNNNNNGRSETRGNSGSESSSSSLNRQTEESAENSSGSAAAAHQHQQRNGCVICASVLYGGIGAGVDYSSEGMSDIVKNAQRIHEAIVGNYHVMNRPELIKQAVECRRTYVEEPYLQRTGRRLPRWTEENLRNHLQGQGFGCNFNIAEVTKHMLYDLYAVHAMYVCTRVARRNSATGEVVPDDRGVGAMARNVASFEKMVNVFIKLNSSTAGTQSISDSLATNHPLPALLSPNQLEEASISRQKATKIRSKAYKAASAY